MAVCRLFRSPDTKALEFTHGTPRGIVASGEPWQHQSAFCRQSRRKVSGHYPAEKNPLCGNYPAFRVCFFQPFRNRSLFQNAHRWTLSAQDRQPRKRKTDNMASDVLGKTPGLALLWPRLGPVLGWPPLLEIIDFGQLFDEIAF